MAKRLMRTAPSVVPPALSTAPDSLRLGSAASRRTLQDIVYAALRNALMCGEFGPGERLTVSRIATALGTSIMPVREAFRRFTSEGALEPLSTGATRVPVIDSSKLEALTEIRLMLEGLATRKAAIRATVEDTEMLARVNAEIQRAYEAKDTAGEAAANERFHFAIYRMSGSTDLVRLIEQLWLRVGPYLAWLLKQGRWPKRPPGMLAFRHHREIITAFRRGDPEAAEAALRADLSMAAEVLIGNTRKWAASQNSEKKAR